MRFKDEFAGHYVPGAVSKLVVVVPGKLIVWYMVCAGPAGAVETDVTVLGAEVEVKVVVNSEVIVRVVYSVEACLMSAR